MKAKLTNLRSRRSRSRSRIARAGFTLIEMVLVLGIIALLLGAGIFLLGGVTESAEDTVVLGDLKTFAVALTNYKSKSRTGYPTNEQGLEALVNKPTSAPVPKRWIQAFPRLPLDPWGQAYKYKRGPQGTRNKDYDLWSIGPDGVDGTEDDIGNWDE